MKKAILAFIIFGFLVLLETSFFVHFKFLNTFSFIFILIILVLINLFEKEKETLGIYSALIGGFFLDLFSEKIFGFWLILCFLISFFVKFFVKRYVSFPLF